MSEYIVDIPNGWYPARHQASDLSQWEMVAHSNEIIRCKDCKHFAPAGYEWDEYEDNTAEHDSCIKFSDYDYEWFYMHWFKVEPNNFCCWGEVEE